MRALLEQALGGEEKTLGVVAEKIAQLKRENGIFVMEEIAPNPYRAGSLLYPSYMAAETKIGKKAGYADIAMQLGEWERRLWDNYTTEDAAWFLNTLSDTLAAASPEIYEHYRTIQDLLRFVAGKLVEREGLVMTELAPYRLKTDLDDRDKTALVLMGEVITKACEREQLSGEKYAALGDALRKAC